MRILIILLIGFLYGQSILDDIEKEQEAQKLKEEIKQEIRLETQNDLYYEQQRNEPSPALNTSKILGEYLDNQLKKQSGFASPSRTGQYIKVSG